MRLREIKSIIEKYSDEIKLDATYGANNQVVTIKNSQNTVNVLEQLFVLDFLKDDIEQLRLYQNIYNSAIPEIAVSASDYRKFLEVLTLINMKCNTVILAIEQAIIKQDENSISVKLPKFLALKDIANFTNELDKALSQLICNKYVDGVVQLQNFDSGSEWYEILVGTQAAVMLIGGAVWSAVIINKKIVETELIKKSVQAIGIGNESLEILKKGLDSQVNLLCESESNQLLHINGIENYDNEYLQRVQLSIKIFAELIRKGAEIHHSLMAPETVYNLFPNFKKLGSIQSKTLQLEEDKEKDTNDETE